MRSRGIARVGRGIGAILALFMASGCGAPDLSSMHPSVAKKAALVFLVGNNLPHWSTRQVDDLQTSTGLVLKTQTVSNTRQVLSQVRGLVNRQLASLPLLVVVADGPPDAQFISFLRQHNELRVEWLSRQTAHVQLQNLRQVVENPQLAAYATGWLAGSAAMEVAQPVGTVGWFVNGNQQPAPEMSHAVLAGLYNSDTVARVEPLSLAGLRKLPKVVIVWGAVPSGLRQLAAASGAWLVTPPSTDASTDTVSLALPPVSALASDLKLYAKNRWHGGIHEVNTAPQIEVKLPALPANLQTNLERIQTTLASQPGFPDKQWQTIAADVKQKWQVSLGVSA
ncbi:MAG: hypothetical protein K6T63_08895 [Alicyclobacillus herbarius]|uniref:hypothetical protein n=1 Tax=Alicyclobacillus herbarius TaxID=122960 RepID=UPI0023552DC7|nr:hypothetical protein [Alicyclobacillus herbarius]MCL6632736.1 hypothetical protein [Alicyclobacillus herbarius]